MSIKNSIKNRTKKIKDLVMFKKQDNTNLCYGIFLTFPDQQKKTEQKNKLNPIN